MIEIEGGIYLETDGLVIAIKNKEKNHESMRVSKKTINMLERKICIEDEGKYASTMMLVVKGIRMR